MSDLQTTSVSPSHRSRLVARAGLIALIVLVLLAIGATRTVLIRNAQSRQLEEAAKSQGKLYVTTIRAELSKDGRKTVLPGTLQGFIESPIYARSNGYLLRWNKDIGSRVKKGEVLAEIDTPEVDQQLAQAIAARRQTAASLELTKSSVDRWEQMRQRDVVSQQELDERKSAFAQAQANLAAADADVARLQNLTAFKRIVAPFSGLVTQRNVDVGDLITAGNAKPLFVLSQTDPLKVYIYVPQTYASQVKVGQAVEITQSETPGQVLHGKIARTAGAIDTATRTLQVEVDLPNADGALLPGAYVQVALPAGAAKTLTVPVNALLFRAEGPRAAVVGADNKVKMQEVKIGQDFGSTLEIISGLQAGDRLIINPADSLVDGVEVVATDKPADKPKDENPGKAGGKEKAAK